LGNTIETAPFHLIIKLLMNLVVLVGAVDKWITEKRPHPWYPPGPYSKI
jgi:hypothetical protein